MSDVTSEETQLRLRRLTLGETTELLTDKAPRFGYSVGATGPRAFRLARVRRKQLVRKVTESIAVALSEDRSGTIIRFVGPIDAALVHSLEKADVPLAPGDVRSSRSVTAPAAAGSKSDVAVEQPIGVVGQDGSLPSWLSSPATAVAPPQPAARPEPVVAAEPGSQTSGAFSAASQPVETNELDGATVARSSLAATEEAELEMDDGRKIGLLNPVVLGRNPSTDKTPSGTEPVRLADRLLSKTHALVEQDSGTVWVTDLHSTNGTSIEVGGISTELQPGQRHLANDGSVVLLGGTRLTIRANT